MTGGEERSHAGRATKKFEYRGTALGRAELSWLRAEAGSVPSPTVVDLARRACRKFGWLRPNGEWAVASCSAFLRTLSRHGVLELPAVRAPSGRLNWRDAEAQMLRALGTIPGMVECQPSGPLTVRPIAAEEWMGFRLHLDRYHYLGFVKPSGESLCYAALLGNELVALLVWGSAVPHNAPRDRYIGWGSDARKRMLPWVVNNQRFLLLPWIRQPHLASRILGANLRRLSRDWQAKYAHSVLLAETFVDVARFRGTCYRASNWTHVGQTQGFTRLRGGFAANHRPKAIFVYPLHRGARQELCAGATR